MSASTLHGENHATPASGNNAASTAGGGSAAFRAVGSPAGSVPMFGSPMGMYFPYPPNQQMMMMSGGSPGLVPSGIGGSASTKRLTISLDWTTTSTTTAEATGKDGDGIGSNKGKNIKLRRLVRDQEMSVEDFLYELFTSVQMQDEYLEPLVLSVDDGNTNNTGHTRIGRKKAKQQKLQQRGSEYLSGDDPAAVHLSLGPNRHIAVVNGKRMKMKSTTSQHDDADGGGVASNAIPASTAKKRKRSSSTSLSGKGRCLRLIMMSISPNGELVQLDPSESLYLMLDDGADANVVVASLGEGSWGGGLTRGNTNNSSRRKNSESDDNSLPVTGGTACEASDSGSEAIPTNNKKLKTQQRAPPPSTAATAADEVTDETNANRQQKKKASTSAPKKSSTARATPSSSPTPPVVALKNTPKQKKTKETPSKQTDDKKHATKSDGSDDEVDDDELIGDISNKSQTTVQKAPPKVDSGNKTTSKKKDPNAPKKGRNAYMIFTHENRLRLKEENPEATSQELTSIVGKAYKGLTPEERGELDRKVEKEKERYKAEMAMYTKQQQQQKLDKNTNDVGRGGKESTPLPSKSQKSGTLDAKIDRTDHTQSLLPSSVPIDFDFTDQDVLVAGNAESKKHSGNVKYRECCKSKRDEYNNFDNDEKTGFVTDVVKLFTFWRKGKEDDPSWNRMEIKDARHKIASDLRPRRPNDKGKNWDPNEKGDTKAPVEQNEKKKKSLSRKRRSQKIEAIDKKNNQKKEKK